MIALALLLAFVAPQDAQRRPPTFTVTAADGSKQTFLGFVAFGTEEVLGKLDAAAKAKNLATARADEGGKLELMVFFDSKTDKKTATALYAQASSGAFGALQTGMLLVPQGAVRPN
ncbi:hypothetical protein HZY97_04290 [Sphingomonas sp. R-74633]|uniref:hypothetical protein n=1 Tax=Sphingomonas sp. R-74633 TaxID=2751188 RepID=UPI0015D24005|nr:hypothetical protein [Sphingomonas sp. R-74633]NYT39964.1 hypothetical protein [Sphingomonas sp. R-74633]